MSLNRMKCSKCGSTVTSREPIKATIRCENKACHGAALQDDLSVEEIAVALSGGGHRAALFGMGVLIALVDLRLNSQVTYISSVSGGSITNAFVGLKCEFDKETPKSFERVARAFVSVIVNQGILTKSDILTVFGILLLPLVGGAYLAYRFGFTPAGAGMFLTGLFVFLALALLRGLIVERRLTIRLFHDAAGEKSRFEDFKSINVEHVLCCTELASGSPVYFSSSAAGQVSIRLLEEEDIDSEYRHQKKPCPRLPIAAAVRASAAFPPGITARCLYLRNLGSEKPETNRIAPQPTKDKDQVRWPLFLSDGGVWNNLATQSILEDKVLAAIFKPEVVFVANASAAFQSTRSWPFHLPGWAEIKTVLQAIWVQNRNTVEPRLASLRERLKYRLKHDVRPSSAEPFVVPIDLSKSVQQTALEFAIAGSADVFPERSEDFRTWTRVLVWKLTEWEKESAREKLQTQKDTLYELVRKEFGQKPDTSQTRTDYVQNLVGHYTAEFEKLTRRDLHTLPTTLNRIERETAIHLLARGYANTHVLAYSLELTDTTEIKMTRERLERLTAPSP